MSAATIREAAHFRGRQRLRPTPRVKPHNAAPTIDIRTWLLADFSENPKTRRPSASLLLERLELAKEQLPNKGLVMAKAAQKITTAAPKQTSISKDVIAEHVSNELVFAIVGHVGSGNTEVAKGLKEVLERQRIGTTPFTVAIIKARTVIEEGMKALGTPLIMGAGRKLEDVKKYQDAGDTLRKGERVSTANNEPTGNQSVNQQMCKKRKMRWSRLDAQPITLVLSAAISWKRSTDP